jgi:hypothetical protein
MKSEVNSLATIDTCLVSAHFSIKTLANISVDVKTNFCFASISKFLCCRRRRRSLSEHTHFVGFVYEVVKGSYLPQNWFFFLGRGLFNENNGN